MATKEQISEMYDKIERAAMDPTEIRSVLATIVAALVHDDDYYDTIHDMREDIIKRIG